MTTVDPAIAAIQAAIAALPKPIIINADMPKETLTKCIELTSEALCTHKVEKDQAMMVKKALELWNGALWHVIIGQAYGASICHEVHNFVLFKIGRVHILCFSSFDESSLVNTEKKVVARAVQKKAEEEEGPAE
jgi:hypothetical protein